MPTTRWGSNCRSYQRVYGRYAPIMYKQLIIFYSYVAMWSNHVGESGKTLHLFAISIDIISKMNCAGMDFDHWTRQVWWMCWQNSSMLLRLVLSCRGSRQSWLWTKQNSDVKKPRFSRSDNDLQMVDFLHLLYPRIIMNHGDWLAMKHCDESATLMISYDGWGYGWI